MADGNRVHSGAVAADTRVLPMGSLIHVEGYGQYTVTDTGGAIKGSRLDLWIPNCSAAKKFGRRTVRVRISRYGY